MSDANVDPLTRLAQADLLLWLSRALGRPSDGWRETLFDENEALFLLAERADCRAESARLLRVAGLLREPAAAALLPEHARLFDAALACPPNETAYVRRDKGAILADITGFYRAFGFRLADAVGEKADHIAAELQFAALLLVMWARARAAGDAESAEVTGKALAAFADEHLGAWIDSFGERLAATARSPFYAELALLLRAVWLRVIEANGLPQPAAETSLPVVDAGSCYECGGPPTGAPPAQKR